MIIEEEQNVVAYTKSLHWPPYTYRDYPEVTSETLKQFEDLLQTENTNYADLIICKKYQFLDSQTDS